MNTQMTATELKERLSRGEDPLGLSIEKWERLISYLEENDTVYDEDLLIGGATCALCAQYVGNCRSGCLFYIHLSKGCANLSYGELVDYIDSYCEKPLYSSDLLPLAHGVLDELIKIRDLIKEESNV